MLIQDRVFRKLRRGQLVKLFATAQLLISGPQTIESTVVFTWGRTWFQLSALPVLRELDIFLRGVGERC